jgi:hypothetical protein
MTLTAAATHSTAPPGLFLLVWGLGASAVGLLTVTNFRGFADNYARRAAQSAAGRRRTWPRNGQQSLLGDWQRPFDPAAHTRRMRLIAIPFAVVGPIVTVIGLVSIHHEGIRGFGPGARLGGFGYLFIAFAVVIVGWHWRSSRGLFHSAGRRGGWRLAIAVVASVGMLVFGVGVAVGQLTIAIVAVAVIALPCLVLVMGDKPAGPGPGPGPGQGPGDLPG